MIMNKQIEKYIFDHSTPEDPVLEELYRQTHIKFVNPNRSTGFIQGKFLELISGMIKPSNILEIGTFPVTQLLPGEGTCRKKRQQLILMMNSVISHMIISVKPT